MRTPADRTKRLTLKALDLARISAPAALEL
jgi:hypothetical protein